MEVPSWHPAVENVIPLGLRRWRRTPIKTLVNKEFRQFRHALQRERYDLVIDAQAVAAFEEGTRVFHQKFGYGRITGIEGDKLTIDFDKAGEKRVVASFVTTAESAAQDVPF